MVRVTESEAPPLDAALGRILAEDVVAPHDVPPHDNSAVDGYAVHFDDIDPEGDTVLPVTGRAAAGHPLGRAARRDLPSVTSAALFFEGSSVCLRSVKYTTLNYVNYDKRRSSPWVYH